MLRAMQSGWFSSDLTVFDTSGMPVARVVQANWREAATLEVGEGRYEAHSKGWRSKEFILEAEDGRVVIVAEKPSAWSNRFVFEQGGKRYDLEKESVWGGTFVIRREGVGLVGSVRSKGVFKREWMVDLPEEVPLEVRVFVVWLVVLLYRRASSYAGAGGAVGAAG